MPTRLLAIVGSVTPPGRLLNATRWLLDSASASRKDVEVELINLADKKIAFADGRPPEQYKDDTAAIIESVRAADGLIVASPVYRGSFTGALKTCLIIYRSSRWRQSRLALSRWARRRIIFSASIGICAMSLHGLERCWCRPACISYRRIS